jgi:hypothetical protein
MFEKKLKASLKRYRKLDISLLLCFALLAKRAPLLKFLRPIILDTPHFPGRKLGIQGQHVKTIFSVQCGRQFAEIYVYPIFFR